MPILSGSRNTLFFVPVALNANELLLAAPFSRIELRHYISYLLKNTCFGSDYHVYHVEIMRFKPY